jgi:cytochrome c
MKVLSAMPTKTAQTLVSSVIVALSLFGTSVAMANPDLAKAKNCASCHSPEKGILGPSYQAVAQKYVNDKNALSKLTEKVMAGGVGVWGKIPMPANPQVSKEEAETLVKWVLSQK